MYLLKAHKSFFIILFLLILIVGGVGTALIISSSQLRNSKSQFESLKSELRSILALEIAITKENLEISNNNLRQIYELKDSWSNFLGMLSPSKTPIECYLNLQRDVSFLRETALAANTEINSKCHFGFLKYLGTEKLPSAESAEGLNQQSQIIKAILSTLIQVKPKEILFVKREAVTGEMDLGDEILSLSAHQRLNIHHIFYSNLLKISFIANTDSLRSFLNKIEVLTYPIFIRDIEVSRCFNDKVSLQTNEEYAIFSVLLEVLNIRNPIK